MAKEDVEERDDETINSIPLFYIREAPKVGRNDPYPCGSGKKYKKRRLPAENQP
ncbi:MAG: SEC-C metal-binding domain-containing protein [Burkholderiales bacterium]